MKRLVYLIALALTIASCRKVMTEKGLPELATKQAIDSLGGRDAWVELIARQKRDSLDKVDSIAALTGKKDNESLLNKTNMFVAYVEVNNRSLRNVTCFVAPDGTPLVDLAIIFAPNININGATGKPNITYNSQVTALINAGYIRYVKSKGIKVGMDILGNHDRSGWQAFGTLAEATEFARHVASEVRRLDIDALSFDDEYSEYEKTYTESFVMVVSEIKRLLPDKLIMCDIYGGASSSKWNGKIMGDVADVAIPITYPGSFNPGYLNFPAKNQLFSEKTGGIQYSDTQFKSFLDKGYKGVMHFDFKTFQFPTYEAYYRSRMLLLKNKEMIVIPGCVDSREMDGINDKIN